MIAGIDNWILAQSTAAVVLILGHIFAYRYFTGRIKAMDIKAEKQDEALQKANDRIFEVQSQSSNMLMDINTTLQKWLIKDEQNYNMKKDINVLLIKNTSLLSHNNQILQDLKSSTTNP